MTETVPIKTDGELRADVMQALLADWPKADLKLEHRFTPGLYSRELFMPAGSVVVGCKHKTEHQFVMLSGRLLLWTEDKGVVEMVAPCIGVTPVGTRRVALIKEDTRWVCFHPTTETDLDKLHDALVEMPDVQYVHDALKNLLPKETEK